MPLEIAPHRIPTQSATAPRWNDEFLKEDIIGPPECRYAKLNVTMPARLVTDVTEVDVTVPEIG
jgi:hypothetical protein